MKRQPKLLNDLYRSFSPNTPESFIANVIFTRYNKNRKKMLQGLYNIINGGPRHYWGTCSVAFAPFQMKTILATPDSDNSWSQGQVKEIDINNLVFYA